MKFKGSKRRKKMEGSKDMNASFGDEDLAQCFLEDLGKPPQPDFAAWKEKNPVALEFLGKLPTGSNFPGRGLVKPIGLVGAFMILAVSVLFFLWPVGLDKSAFATSIPGIDDPITITWTTTFYVKATSKDGERSWIYPERRLYSYRHPGQYRETRLDMEGKPYAVEVNDSRVGRSLYIDLKEKKALLKFPSQTYDSRGPFAWVGEAIRDRMVAKSLPVKSVSMQGKKEFEKKQVNVIRAMIDEGNADGVQRRDFYFDEATKNLMGIWMPNKSDFNWEAATDKNNKPEKEFSMMIPLGSMVHEIDLNPKVEAKDFALDPPTGFKLEKGVKPTVTEEEMIVYLGAAAKFQDGIFPDSPFAAFDSAKFLVASKLPEGNQTFAQKEMIAQHGKFLMREIYRSPVQQFVDDQTVAGSFHYVGSGAKIDDARQIVCWYRLKGSSRPRAVFADLKIKEVDSSELPFDLKK